MFDVQSGGSLAQFGTGLLFAAAALSLGTLSTSRSLVGVALTVAALYAIYGVVSAGQRVRGRSA